MALPGDMFGIKDAHYRVRGVGQALGNVEAQDILAWLIRESVEKDVELLPEPYIVGVATRIWKSVDPVTGNVRWDRVMKRIE